MASPECYALAELHVRPALFPFLGILWCRNDGVEIMLDRLEGFCDRDFLRERLVVVHEAHAAHLDQMQQAQHHRTESVSLRSEQDVEFERALVADRERTEADREKAELEQVERFEREQAADLREAISLSHKLVRSSLRIFY
jgi:hypothetical protein